MKALDLAAIGQLQKVKGVKHTTLGCLQPGPFLTVAGHRQIRNGFVELTVIAKGQDLLGVVRAEQTPVAHLIELIVPAFHQPDPTGWMAAGIPAIHVGNQSRDAPAGLAPAQLAAAAGALGILEKNPAPAGTRKAFHLGLIA